jgi:hypothetical protein
MLRVILVALAASVLATSPARDVTTAFSCSVDLGVGIKSKRKFCDIVVSTLTKDGVTMAIPPHTGPTTLRFDLHNRYTLGSATTPAQLYARQTAIVAVLDQAGVSLGKGAVSRELRTEVDLFDRIAGGIGPAGAIAVAPGRPEPVVIELPEAVTLISVVGVSLEATSLAEQGTFITPGRPVAVGSNFRIEYTRK